MALLVRELLHDFANSKLDFISSIDLVATFEMLYRDGKIDDLDMACIKLYLLGKMEPELDRVCYNHRERIVKVCRLVCAELRYDIASILDRGMEMLPQYKAIRGEFEEFVDRMITPVYAQPYTEGFCGNCGSRVFLADLPRAKELFSERGVYPCRKCRAKLDLD